jgi:hypothetical protein
MVQQDKVGVHLRRVDMPARTECARSVLDGVPCRRHISPGYGERHRAVPRDGDRRLRRARQPVARQLLRGCRVERDVESVLVAVERRLGIDGHDRDLVTTRGLVWSWVCCVGTASPTRSWPSILTGVSGPRTASLPPCNGPGTACSSSGPAVRQKRTLRHTRTDTSDWIRLILYAPYSSLNAPIGCTLDVGDLTRRAGTMNLSTSRKEITR